ncbi:MAG: hypothetical protein KAR42_06730 [candidate division Zixibacteria bacterium]|nr:hypothetical protein [candidate division Zixibacteria bacterium]
MREFTRLFLLILLLSVFTAALLGQSDGLISTNAFDFSKEELSKGRSILLKAVEKCGGIENFKKVKNFTLTCKFEAAGQDAFDYRETRVFPNKIAKEMTTPFGVHTSVFNGDEGWTISNDQKVMMSPIEVKQCSDELKLDQFSLYTNADNESIKVAYKNDDKYNGVDVFHLRVSMDDKEAYSMYIDKESYLVLGLLHETMTQMGSTKLYVNLYDYTKFGDITLPSRIEQVIGERKNIVSDMNYEIDGKIDESIFIKPSGL